ncbi:MAG: metallophosphoesterase [Spirochaetales bacterium]|jgi:Icc-related predicted phosphoesterase|nr:metallophosphoesterase [Spirochaetales bacterium]
MKILCISDESDPLVYSKNIASRYADVDAVIAAGDLPLKYYEFIISSLNKPLFFVFGNHNLEFLHQFTSNAQPIMQYGYTDGKMQVMPSFGGDFIDGKVLYYRKHDLIIAGLGGSIRYNKGKHQFTEREMYFRMLKMVPQLLFNRIFRGRYVDILVTHAAPLGLGDDTDRCHQGFSTFLTFMQRFKPRYLLHGHVHLHDMNANRQHVYKQTQVINIFQSYILQDPKLGRGGKHGKNRE